jgi:hypothetical protein
VNEAICGVVPSSTSVADGGVKLTPTIWPIEPPEPPRWMVVLPPEPVPPVAVELLVPAPVPVGWGWPQAEASAAPPRARRRSEGKRSEEARWGMEPSASESNAMPASMWALYPERLARKAWISTFW